MDGTRKGIWNGVCVLHSYLIKSNVLEDLDLQTLIHGLETLDVEFCRRLREKNIFMYVSNMRDFGHFLGKDQHDPVFKSELWMILDENRLWRQHFVSPDYHKQLQGSVKGILEPCRDVFVIPLFKEVFANDFLNHLLAMETTEVGNLLLAKISKFVNLDREEEYNGTRHVCHQ